MKINAKWTIYQIISLIIFIICYSLIHHYMDYNPVKPNNTGNLFLLGGLLYFPISWIYITIYFQQKKQPKLMEYRIWRALPVLIIGVGFVSMIAFIMLVTMGPFMEWMEQGSWIFYVFITYATVLYFLFMMSIVHRMSESKHNIIHHSYVWSLVVIIGISFLF